MGHYCLIPSKKYLLRSLWILPLLLICVWMLWRSYDFYYRPFPLEQRVFSVEKGASFHQITEKMQAEGLIDNRWLLWAYCGVQGLWRRLQAGDYALHPSMHITDLIDHMVQGRQIEYAWTIVPGWNHQDLLASLRSLPHIEPMSIAQEQAFLEDKMRLYFPDTYYYRAHSRALELLNRAHSALEKELDSAWAQASDHLSLQNPQELLILASIIEKESGDPTERFLIAGVFHERLKRGMPLQADPTVRYAHQLERHRPLTREHLQRDHPDNTYTRRGLPTVPIAFPSRSSLLAAAHPSQEGYLYFMLQKDGQHYFSKSYAEHLQAVRRYRTEKRP